MNYSRIAWILPAAMLACGGESSPSSPAGVQSGAANSPDSVQPPPPPPPSAAKRDSVILRPGEPVTVAGLTLKFLNVPEDSRRPTGVQCVWAGNGVVRLEAAQGSVGEILTLNTTIEPRSAAFTSYRISLLFLEPYPAYGSPTMPERYRAHVLVEAI